MYKARSVSFAVEALESRILLSATPLDSTLPGEEAPSEAFCVSAIEVEEIVAEEAASAEEPSAELFEGGTDLESPESPLPATVMYPFSEVETSAPAIFQSGFTVIDPGVTHTFRSTTGGIFFSGPGSI